MIPPTEIPSLLEGREGVRPSPSGRRKVWADLAGCAALALVSLLIGVLINQLRRQPLPLWYHAKLERLQSAVNRLSRLGPGVVAPVVVTTPPQEIELEEFRAFVASRVGVVVDARPALIYALGHVPGAINISREQFDADYQRAGDTLGSRKGDIVAVYCSDADCPDSELVAEALGALDFRQLRIYREGWEGWSQANLPGEK